MIEKVEIKNFKKFRDTSITLHSNEMSFVVGGNNAGKSSLLHALAVWQFCKMVLIYEKGEEALLENYRGVGYGIGIDDFTPLNIPSFKYLWTNLSPGPGYSLSIKCYWNDPDSREERFLAISLSLVQERLFIKNGESNVKNGEHIPRIAYLPPFAGISDKEQWYSPAMRQKLVGQGLAGAVLRNEIVDLYSENIKIRTEKKGNAKKISRANLAYIRLNDPFELLQQVLYRTFSGLLSVKPFNMAFHTHVNVLFCKGNFVNQRFHPLVHYNKRDIMVEGSGFLQWLSVYTFALSPNVDVLLLDEPDAHLHTSLQYQLIKELILISQKFRKQILVATHSAEIIKNVPYENVLYVQSATKIDYLSIETNKTIVLAGLGMEYCPKLDKIQQTRRILFVENDSDAQILQILAQKYTQWPTNLVIWPSATHHTERKHVFDYLKRELQRNFKCMSLGDKDTKEYSTITPSLHDKSYPDVVEANNVEMKYRVWRRSEIENYLMDPIVMARLVCKKKHIDGIQMVENEIRTFIQNKDGIVINANFRQSDRTDAIKPLFEISGKEIIAKICKQYNINKYEIAEEMEANEIFDDIKIICSEIVDMCN